MRRAAFSALLWASSLTACGATEAPRADAAAEAPPADDAGPPACTSPPKDSDGDGISDNDESSAIRLDTDGDGTPDYLDLDSDDDGIPDAVEAGDDNLCTPPVDTDHDGVPDFRDTDADGNGMPDKIEGAGDHDGDGIVDADDPDDDNDTILDADELAPGGTGLDVDTDGDGTPDRFDLDSDGDGIPDELETAADRDGDKTPNQRDLDSDGDCIPDHVEAGPDPTHPLNSDDDGFPDFLDYDSDNDGLPDAREDKNCNGVVDAGESDPRQADTDGDGFPDLVEVAAGSNPADATSKLDPRDFYFVLPYMDPSQSALLDFQTDIVKADLLFQMDTTGSMGGVVASLQSTLQKDIAPGAAKVIPNLDECVSSFQDFPVGSFGGCGGGGAREDAPFRLVQRCSNSLALTAAGIDTYDKPMGCGGDGPEAGFEALYQAATGEGISWGSGGVPKFNPSADVDATLDMGPVGGVGFRTGALPIIVHITDTVAHDKGDYAGLVDGAHSRDDALAALKSLGARVIGISVEDGARAELEKIALATGAAVSPLDAFPGAMGKCLTGFKGAKRPPDASGLCPLVFQVDYMGTGLAEAIIDAIHEVAFHASIDVSGLALGDPARLPGLDTGNFIKAIVPRPPAPPGASVEGTRFRRVRPGSPVRFTVRAQNDIVRPGAEPQLYVVRIQILGDLVTVLDERRVFVVVPPVQGPG